MKYDPADIFFIAGEASGDLQASLLAGAVASLRPGLRFAAIGGDRLRSTGAQIVYDSSELASIGPIAILPRIPLLYAALRWLDRAMRTRPSRLLVLVDAGAFNLRLVRRLRAGGYQGRVVYYFPPGAWLDNAEQARAVALSTMPLTPFAHQRDFYQRLGLPIAYFGHPLVSVIEPRSAQPVSPAPLIAVLPGSRREEAARHLPILAEAARELSRVGAASFTVVAASEPRAAQIRATWARASGPQTVTISRESATQVLQRADIAWIAAGTAVLEAALVGVPQVSFYLLSRSQYRIAQHRLPPHLLNNVALPNLVMGRTIIPELLQDQLTAHRLSHETLALLEHDSRRNAQLEAYAELRTALGPRDALQLIAAFVADQLEEASAGCGVKSHPHSLKLRPHT